MNSCFVAVVVMFCGYGTSLEIVPITEWGGSELQYEYKLANPVPFAIIHHSVSFSCNTGQECLDELKKQRNYFITHGIGDIPYSFMIGGNGKVYEGAGWHNRGAHTHYNQSFGICFIGDFREISPTPEALKAAQELLSYGLQNKHLSHNYKLVGARQLRATLSPGSALQTIIENWPHWTPTPNILN